MKKAIAKEKLQKLLDDIDQEYGVGFWINLIADKGKATYLMLNNRVGGAKNKDKAFKKLLAWARKNKLPIISLRIDESIGNKAYYEKHGFKKQKVDPGALMIPGSQAHWGYSHWYIRK